jgi:anaerobic selenocysteine-containing dehydrogenase
VLRSRRDVRSYCRICAASCGILVSVDGDRVERVRGDPDHPVSRGYTCPKGRALAAWHHGPARLDEPMLRGEPATWDEVLDDLATTVRSATATGGSDAVGAYLATGLAYDICGWMTAERLLRRLRTRQRYTPVTVDNAPVLRAAELVTGTSELNTVWDPERSRLLLLFGTNPVVSHGYGTTLADPVSRLRDFRGAGGRIWVIDPRRTETAALADAHLATRPGTDHLVLAWLVRELLADGADHVELDAHCDPGDVDRLTRAVAPYDLERVATTTGLDAGDLRALLGDVRAAGRVAAMCGTGVTMSRDGVVAEWLRWVLLIVTGSVDRDGGMRCNQGWLFPLDTRTWPTPAKAAGAGPSSRPELGRWLGQLPCVALADEIERGPLRVLLVGGGNPLTAFPDASRTAAALGRLDALAVLDVTHTSLTDRATHVLPVTGQLERADVSMLENVSSSNGTQHTPAVVARGADRRPAWWVFAQLAVRLDLDLLGGLDPDACDDETVLRGIAANSRGGYDELVAAGPHGVRAPDAYGWVHEQVLPDGRWQLAPDEMVERLAAVADPDARLVVAPRRRIRSMNSARYVGDGDLAKEPPEVRLHPDDAASCGIDDGDSVVVASANGEMRGTARVDAGVRPGVLSCTHGVVDVNVGHLTSARDGVDATTGMPQASGIAVTITSVE